MKSSLPIFCSSKYASLEIAGREIPLRSQQKNALQMSLWTLGKNRIEQMIFHRKEERIIVVVCGEQCEL